MMKIAVNKLPNTRNTEEKMRKVLKNFVDSKKHSTFAPAFLKGTLFLTVRKGKRSIR